MSEPTDFKNREYRMVFVDWSKPVHAKMTMDQLHKDGWTPEDPDNSPEWIRHTHRNREADDLVFVLPYSRPRTTP